MDDPSMMPDLSHLSAEEREIIEQVFKRQRDEEAKETQLSQKASEELSELDKQINERKETSKKLIGTQDDAICQICQKTKFADGIGHKCFYCQLRSCARCGGRAQSKNKAIWACSLCQKRQQILAKTGKWFQPDEPNQPKISVSEATPTQGTQSPSSMSLSNSQYGMNGPNQQGQRQTEPPDRQQYQNQNQGPMNQPPINQGPMQGPNNHGPMNQGPNNQGPMHEGPINQGPMNQGPMSSNQMPPNQQHPQNRRQQSIQQQHPNQNQQQAQKQFRNQQQSSFQQHQQQPQSSRGPGNGPPQQQQQQQNMRPNQQQQQQFSNQNQNMNQNPNQQQFQQNQNQGMNQNQNQNQGFNQQNQNYGPNNQMHNNQGQNQYQNQNQNHVHQNQKFQTGESNNIYKQPSLERTASQGNYNQQQDMNQQQRPTFYTGNSSNDLPFNQQQQQQQQDQSMRKNPANRVTEEDYATSSNFEAKKQRNHNSQNQPQNSNSQGVRACPPNDDHLNRVKNRLHRQLRSMSSSEEDIMAGGGGSTLKMSTSAVVAAGNKTSFHDEMGASNVQRLSEECNSEKDLLRYIYGDCKNPDQAQNPLQNMQSGRRREKSLSVSPSRNHDQFGSGSVSGGDLLATRIRTFLSHPVTWQPSADQKRLIGHMILHRTENSTSNGDLGLKIVGGRRTDTGKLGAFVTQVKPGSVADTIGRLRPGDEVVEWNGQSMQNATYEQVYDSIAASRYDTQVELIVSRSAILPGGDDFLNMSQGPSTSIYHQPKPSSSYHHQQQQQRQLPNPELFVGPSGLTQKEQQLLSHSQSAVFAPSAAFTSKNRSTSSYYYPDAADLGAPSSLHAPQTSQQTFGTGHIFGRIEVSFVYSHHDRQLSVALERAFDLPPRPDGTPRNPYVKIFLLPDRSEKSRRQSAVIAETLMPVWDEVFYYNGLSEPMLLQRVLEMTVWDYDKFGTNSFLGETLIDLASVPLDGEHSLMCTLVDMDDDNPLRTRLKLRKSSYHQPTRRPQSELNYYDHSYYNNGSQSGLERDEENDEYLDDDDLENDIDLATGNVIRKSRGYRRDKMHGYADWSMNHQRPSGSGYLSDHGYGRQNMISRTFNRRQHRRPRSATALMHSEVRDGRMGRDDMYDHRKYSKHSDRPEEDDYAINGPQTSSQYYGGENSIYEDSRYKITQPHTFQHPHNHTQGHNHNHNQNHSGQLQPQQQPIQQSSHHLPVQPGGQPQQGYYSDGSETMSVHSCNSMPMITTINRRNMAAASNAAENNSYDDGNRVPIKEAKQSSVASSSSLGNSQSASNSNSAGPMKERKKSLMTRFIPGRSAGGSEAKRTGFARSEEVGIPGNLSSDRLVEPTPPFLKQASKESTDSQHSDNWLPILADGPLGTFVDNLGPGQVVGRQVLASPVLGEIQIGLMAGRSGIDVEIIRAKNLVVKPGVKICPAPYVKVYLMEGKQCVAKAKTNAANKTTCPLFQQHLIFNDNPKKKMLQITVLGDYGRMERKVFMGISQIRLEDLELGSQPLIGWYKLFHSSSLAGTGPVRKDSDVSVGGAQQ